MHTKKYRGSNAIECIGRNLPTNHDTCCEGAVFPDVSVALIYNVLYPSDSKVPVHIPSQESMLVSVGDDKVQVVLPSSFNVHDTVTFSFVRDVSGLKSSTGGVMSPVEFS